LLRLAFSHFSQGESGELPSLLVNIGDCSGTEIKAFGELAWDAVPAPQQKRTRRPSIPK
jgi:hypothetical protein